MNLGKLNESQREAVVHRGSPLLVLAGAGSGKTRVITYRIAHLLAANQAKASQILAVTFTNRAAAEMRERVERLVGKRVAEELTVTTFHSFCAGFLRREIAPLGYSKRFTIYDASDQRTLLTRCLSEFSRNGEKFDPGTFQFRISRAKNKGLTPETYEPSAADKYDDRIPTLWESYANALRARDALDFDDLLVLTHQLLSENDSVLNKTRNRFRQILIDEYQDTNWIQFRIANLLAEKHRNLCAVGDDDQSIYGWRGAEVANILEFERHFPDARVVTLDRNYRSTTTILQAANAVISRNSQRREKNLWSKGGEGEPVEIVTAKDEIDEADFVAETIKTLRAQLDLSWKDFGVLYRSNLQSRPFEMRFRQAKIPYVVTGGTEFFDRKEVKDIAAFLRVVANPRDEVALRRIVNVPARGVGDTSLLRLDEAAKARGIPLIEVLKANTNGNLPDSATNGIREFLSLLKETSQTLRAEGLGKGVHRLILRSGYLEDVEKTSPSPNVAEIRKQIVLEVANAAAAHERAHENASLINFLQESSLAGDYQQNRNEQRYQGEAVRLATLHSAKGLEFPVVFLVGVEEGLLPHSRSMVFDNDVLEERRLMYVGMTRAMRRLILTTATLRTVRGRPKQTLDSRFLSEIPDHLVRFRMSDEPFLGSSAKEIANPAEPRALLPSP